MLTKPPGSLGRLEELGAWLGRWQGRPAPRLDSVHVLVFAGNHGVVAQNVSAYPASVTTQMVANFERGGAALAAGAAHQAIGAAQILRDDAARQRDFGGEHAGAEALVLLRPEPPGGEASAIAPGNALAATA